MQVNRFRRVSLGEVKSFLLETYSYFNVDQCRLMAGAMAYYTLFALPVLLAASYSGTAFFFGWDTAQVRLEEQIEDIVGPSGAAQVEEILEGAEQKTRGVSFATIFAFCAMFYGAIRAFEQLQVALNNVWGVDTAPEHRNMRTTLRKRVFSFFMVWGIIVIIVATLILNVILFAIGDAAGFSNVLFRVGDFVGTLIVVTLLLAFVFKLLPDATVQWRDVWFGAAFTSLLFTVLRTVIGFFLGRSELSDVYGAAGSLAILLIWIYCSSLIVLFGAEVTKVWALHYGSRLEPTGPAARVVTEYVVRRKEPRV